MSASLNMLRSRVALPALRSSLRIPATARAVPLRTFTSSALRRGGHGENDFDPPTGWLWGVKPGEKPEKEGWEGPVYYVFLPSFVLFAIALAFKPDTSLDTWALEEARRRLEKEGILPDPFPEKKD
ncbi:hypothetical protein TD95_001535 [Thielaviopsis punctulata]|uniref:NADH dehydrogenase [ubiquinone] 1 beta subcomplex subunit 11, mitochondrial n=1 Tax=Thielaviopsis punctulata TaxID=72032 RepID=A0A0F4ZIJ9_9PEZI|nr:hypothetical protein TD95_001535 [Thielaviopsis punctulata]